MLTANYMQTYPKSFRALYDNFVPSSYALCAFITARRPHTFAVNQVSSIGFGCLLKIPQADQYIQVFYCRVEYIAGRCAAHMRLVHNIVMECSLQHIFTKLGSKR